MEGLDLIGSKKTYCLRTYSESAESGDDTSFDSEEGLELFRDWMNYVHKVASDKKLSESELRQTLGLDINSHREVYELYKNRKEFLEFFKALASYEGKLRRNINLETGAINLLQAFDEILD